MKKYLIYSIEIITALILLSWDIKYFLFYLFILIFFTFERQRKIIRTFQTFNEIKLLAIMKKLKIKDEEVKNIYEEEINNLTTKDKESLESDIKDALKN